VIDRDTRVIAKREFVERVRSKWFVAGTLLGPIFMVALVIIPALIAGQGGEGTKVQIADKTGVLATALAEGLRKEQWSPEIVDATTSEDTLRERVRTKQINGFITVAPDALDSGPILYQGDNGSSQKVKITIIRVVRDVVRRQRGVRQHLSDAQLDEMLKEVNVDAQHTTGKAAAVSGTASFFIGYIVAFILYMAITLYGVGVMRSVVVEKSSRVMEFMVAAVKPRALMGGKILGVGAAGLLQIGIWLAMGAVTLAYRDSILGVFGVTGGGEGLPSLDLLQIAVVLVYFVLGYFFYSAMYAAAGATVSSEQEIQQVQMPITMLLVVGIVCLQVVSNDPRGSSSELMTMVPLWSPMLMPMRYVLGGASLGEVGISLAILVVSTYLVVRAAAKVYRVGILLYGKRPGLRELVRWLRY
jgi:ABC-2 type transport system permease protein